MEAFFSVVIFAVAGFWPALGMVKGLGHLQLPGKPVNSPDLWVLTSIVTLILLYCAVHGALDPNFLSRGDKLDDKPAIRRAVGILLFFWTAQPLPTLWFFARKEAGRPG